MFPANHSDYQSSVYDHDALRRMRARAVRSLATSPELPVRLRAGVRVSHHER